jgi:asparaginyl-tRNA synthetase
MAQPRLSRCLRLASTHSQRTLHSSAPTTKASLSVAELLDTPPAAPDNVIVNGFVRSVRNQKNRSFASIGDGSSLEPLQALLTPQQGQR